MSFFFILILRFFLTFRKLLIVGLAKAFGLLGDILIGSHVLECRLFIALGLEGLLIGFSIGCVCPQFFM